MKKKKKNKLFYAYIEDQFPHYFLISSNVCDFYYLQPWDGDLDDYINYNIKTSELNAMEWASANTINDVAIMEIFLSSLT